MLLHKEYHKLASGQEIKISIAYTKKTSYHSQDSTSGYWVSVVPVKITKHEGYTMEETGCFTGFVDNLLQVDRQSAKRLETAKKILAERLSKYLEYPFKLN